MIKTNHPAPDVTVTMWDGTEEKLSHFWADKKLVLVFLRHLGWLFCREHVVQLHRKKNQFFDAGARIVLVSMGSVAESAAFKNKFDLSFPMVSDSERELYNIYQIGNMSVSSIFSPKMALRAASAFAKGHGVGIPHGDVRQLSAVFIVETNGIISYSHYAKDAADNPQPEQLLKHLA